MCLLLRSRNTYDVELFRFQVYSLSSLIDLYYDITDSTNFKDVSFNTKPKYKVQTVKNLKSDKIFEQLHNQIAIQDNYDM